MVSLICSAAANPTDRDYMLWLYDEFKNLMFFTAKKYISSQIVCEDIVQDSVVQLIEKIDVIREKERCVLAAYIVSIVRNVSINYLKQESMMQQHTVYLEDSEINNIPCPALPPEELLLAKERAALLSDVLQQLPETEQLLLEGKYILEYSDEELAEQLNCKPSSIRMKLTRARRHALSILTQLEQEGGQLP